VIAQAAHSAKTSRTALVVHFDLSAISSFQSVLNQNGYVTVVARDLPTALLAMTQHYFDVAIVASRLAEGGDGWPLAGVLRLVFPKAFITVLTPGEPDVATLRAAINNGVSELYQETRDPKDIVSAISAQLTGSGASESVVQ
jgi:ActR/RegA family two-component response regulator